MEDQIEMVGEKVEVTRGDGIRKRSASRLGLAESLVKMGLNAHEAGA